MESARAADKKYYWLKLKRDFFKRQDIRIVEDMPNGTEYIVFYLKLLVESLENNGNLRFNDTIPYNENMLSSITNTNIDIVRAAMKVFYELKLIDILEDKTIYMNELSRFVGTETYWAERKRLSREKGAPALEAASGVGQFPIVSNECPTEVQRVQVRDKSLEIREKEKEKIEKKKKAMPDEDKLMNMINTYSNDSKITELLHAYYEMRMRKNKPTTEYAMKLVFKELNKYDDKIKAEMIENSIVNGWTAIYPVKNATNIKADSANVPQANNHTQRKYDDAYYDSLYYDVRKKKNETQKT